MKKTVLFFLVFLCAEIVVSAQNKNTDSTNIKQLKEIVITADKLPVSLTQYSGSVSVVNKSTLAIMPKNIAINEALRLVPGVRIDNQHDGERVHISIRGQGILTERGLRGIGVMVDGIPLNDPSGFAPDLYDIDWATVQDIEVLRGPFASLYGSGGAAGILNITTQNGGKKPFGGFVNQTLGSNAFTKTLAQLNSKTSHLDYRISFSHTSGNGSRDHQAFQGNILYEKINFYPSKHIKITQLISHSTYFQQNPEGLSLEQLKENPNQANPDARPFNEYQKTNRTTLGLIGRFSINKNQDFRITGYLRPWHYKETSNKAAEYRNYQSPGLNLQYNFHLGNKNIRHDISMGVDYKWQKIGMYKLKSAAMPNRVESRDKYNLETNILLANQLITQSGIGLFAIYHLNINRLSFTASFRHDKLNNKLTNKLINPDLGITSKDYNQNAARLGISYHFNTAITAFADWSMGYIPPSTEELANNPLAYYGFNTHLIPSTSRCYEVGFRGFSGNKLYYEITGFIMNTSHDFFRFKQSGRGNQEVFYGNAGNSNRKGLETSLRYQPFKNLKFQAAYTFSNFKYTSASIDPVYSDTLFVLTKPPLPGQYLPNSPKHQLYAEIVYSPIKNISFNFSTEFQSKWAIYTDSDAYAGRLNTNIYQNWQKGFTLFHTGASYQWTVRKTIWQFRISAHNLFNTQYMAFTEPDPDGNAYQPGPGREIFGGLKVIF